jgi:hypothetical protein
VKTRILKGELIRLYLGQLEVFSEKLCDSIRKLPLNSDIASPSSISAGLLPVIEFCAEQNLWIAVFSNSCESGLCGVMLDFWNMGGIYVPVFALLDVNIPVSLLQEAAGALADNHHASVRNALGTARFGINRSISDADVGLFFPYS